MVDLSLMRKGGKRNLHTNDIKKYGYELGTFQLGQTVYHVCDKIHKFRFHKKCEYCDNTGKIFIKDKSFKCPECGGIFENKEVIEKVISEPEKIKSIMTFKNNIKSLEIYINDSSGFGLIIQKQDDGTNNYFGSKEEAQEVSNKYNKENNVDLLLEEYKRREIRENI